MQDKVDIFIVAHLMGYWCKTLIFRDWWLTTVISIMFEFLEYRWGELGWDWWIAGHVTTILVSDWSR